MIKDKGIAWNTKREFLPCFNMLGLLADAAQGAGVPVMVAHPVAASELVGLAIAAAGDEIYTMWPLPWDFDKTEPVRFRLWFTHTTTSADTPDWIVSYKAIAKQAALTDAKATPDENVAFAAKAVSTTAEALEILDWEESVSDTKIETTDKALLIAVECNGLGGASANEITLMGLEVEYTVGATCDSNQRDITRDGPVN